MKISGNTILITGGATGIGLALARALRERDNEVIICGRRAERLDQAKLMVPGLHVRTADVSSSDSREDLARWIASEFPRTNILVNNAGVQHRVDLTDPDELGRARQEVEINFLAPMFLTALMLPQLTRQETAAVVNVSSGLAFAPLAHMPVYCATKAALHSMTLSLRHQLRKSSVRVFEVAPPLVRSELGAAHRPAELNRQGMPAGTAAEEIVRALESDQHELAIGDAANSRAKREALFPLMNPG